MDGFVHDGFKNQVAVITGAGEGIGYEIARQLAQRGVRIALNDIDAEKAREAAEKLDAISACFPHAGNAGDLNVIRDLVERAVCTYGRLDMAIANAGITLWNPFLEYTQEDFQRVVSVNLGGSFFLAQKAARAMISQQRGGRILFMSSVTGRRAMPFLSAYSMTKAGLEGLTTNLVAELAPHRITVNAIAPGATVTPRNLADDPAYESVWGDLVPMGEAAYPKDIARAALFLLSPEAGQLTGQTLLVDGGWSHTSPIPSLDFVDASLKTNQDDS